MAGSCRFVDFVQSPARTSRQASDEAARDGSADYSLRLHVKDADLLPDAAAAALRAVCDRTPSTPVDWVTLATCADAFEDFDHNIAGLLPCVAWVDDDVFDAAHDCIAAHLHLALADAPPSDADDEGPRAQLGVCLSAPLGGRHLVARCVCALPGAVWLVASEESITRSHRLRACILLALHPTATAAVVLNLRTGEAQTFGLTCKEQFRLELAVSVSS